MATHRRERISGMATHRREVISGMATHTCACDALNVASSSGSQREGDARSSSATACSRSESVACAESRLPVRRTQTGKHCAQDVVPLVEDIMSTLNYFQRA